MHGHLNVKNPPYVKISTYITDAPTCFGASAPSAGSFDIAFAKVIKYENYTKQRIAV